MSNFRYKRARHLPCPPKHLYTLQYMDGLTLRLNPSATELEGMPSVRLCNPMAFVLTEHLQ